MIYSATFRRDALVLVKKIGVAKAAKQLHVYPHTLYRWRKLAPQFVTGHWRCPCVPMHIQVELHCTHCGAEAPPRH